MAQFQDNDTYWNLFDQDQITMAQSQDNDIYWHPAPNEELYLLNDEEYSYTGMNKEESKTARGPIEKYIHTSAYLVVKAIVCYQDILTFCSNFGTVTESYEKHLSLIVGSP
ncbi:unnamed protein product [Meganyctiphanes norvegica]|uniref:Uncharacterized protein n=1 Tax=Meganyctiphanes norvegica TaxID=48144 RepID=A0AAV2SCJ5_MEGNR